MLAEIDCSCATAAVSTDNYHPWRMLLLQLLLDGVDEMLRRGKHRNGSQRRTVRISDLMRPGQQGHGSPGVSGMVAKGSNASAVVIRQELDVVQQAIATDESREVLVPALLVLVAVTELDVSMAEGGCCSISITLFRLDYREKEGALLSASGSSLSPTTI